MEKYKRIDYAFLQAYFAVTRTTLWMRIKAIFGVSQPILVTKFSNFKERVFVIGNDYSFRELTEEEKDRDNCYVVLDGLQRQRALFESYKAELKGIIRKVTSHYVSALPNQRIGRTWRT